MERYHGQPLDQDPQPPFKGVRCLLGIIALVWGLAIAVFIVTCHMQAPHL